MVMVQTVAKWLPFRYAALPHVHLGSAVEIDLGAFEVEERGAFAGPTEEGGGVATAVWAPPRPTLAVASDLPDVDGYEVRVYDSRQGRRLVAAVEIVSPANKDRPEHRRAFVAKCAALLQEGVCVGIVDVVTTRPGNLYLDLLSLLGQSDPSHSASGPEGPPSLYAATCRWARGEPGWLLEAWAHPLLVGAPLPTLPL